MTGFLPGIGTAFHINDATAVTAHTDFASAYLQGKALTPTVNEAGLASIGGLTFGPGVYSFDTAVTLGGALTVTGGDSVVLADGATACGVYCVVGSAATIGTAAVVKGNELAGTAISVGTAATVEGGLYAGSAVTLLGNAIHAGG